MRADRLLVSAAALTALAVGALLLFLSAGRDGAPERAFALSPTPIPFHFDWTVEITGTREAGQSLTVHAQSTAVNGGGSQGTLSEPTYTLLIDGDALELASPADVSPASIADGAEWKLDAVQAGDATLTVSLDYLLSYNLTGTPPGSYRTRSETTEDITVSGALAPNGDVNDDGTTNSGDALLILQFAAALIHSPLPNSDVNVSGATDSIDAALILQFDARLVPILPQIPMPEVHVPPVTTKSGLVLYNIEEGTGTMARTNDTVTVHYTGWLENGVMIDSSVARGSPAQFALPTVIEGWQEGVPGMTEGGIRRLVIPPELAYGEDGFPGVVPPNATLIYDIALISVP